MAGAAQVAMLALVARAVRPDVRGRAFAACCGAELAGVAIGPLVARLRMAHMATLFVGAALGALVAGVPVLLARVRPLPQDAVAAGLDGRRAARWSASCSRPSSAACSPACDRVVAAARPPRRVEWQIGLSWKRCGRCPSSSSRRSPLDGRPAGPAVVVVALIASVVLGVYPFITSLHGSSASARSSRWASPWRLGGAVAARPGRPGGVGLFAHQTAAIAVSAALAGGRRIAVWWPFVVAAVVAADPRRRAARRVAGRPGPGAAASGRGSAAGRCTGST